MSDQKSEKVFVSFRTLLQIKLPQTWDIVPESPRSTFYYIYGSPGIFERKFLCEITIDNQTRQIKVHYSPHANEAQKTRIIHALSDDS